MTPKLRCGMVGGGPGAFIGSVHRMALALDGHFELVAGAFSSSEVRSREAGRALGLDPTRVYGCFAEMAEAEAGLDGDRRIHLVVIVTPNHLHARVAKAFLARGVSVACDKPLTTLLSDAEELCRMVPAPEAFGDAAPSPFGGAQPLGAVTYNYSGYPMVREARAIVQRGQIGSVRKVVVEYLQGWLASRLEAPERSGEAGFKQAEWRADPLRGGPSPVLGDIGTHAHHLMRFVTGLEPVRLRAELRSLVPGRSVHDDATVTMELDGGAIGLLHASQAAAGERNHLRLRIYGTEGGLDWCQESPEELRVLGREGTAAVRYRAAGASSRAAGLATRLPGGHPEGFVEAFANIYASLGTYLRKGIETTDAKAHAPHEEYPADYPTFQDGARGVHFVERAVASNEAGSWVDAGYRPPSGP